MSHNFFYWLFSYNRPLRKRCFSSEGILHLDKVIVKDPKFISYPTENEIQFEKLAFSSSKKEIIKSKGRHDCQSFEPIGSYRIEVIGYYEKMMGLPIRVIFFLNNNKFFFGEYCFSAAANDLIPEIRQLFCKNYLAGESATEESFYIENEDHVRILFHFNGISLSVKYYNPTCSETDHAVLTDLFTWKCIK
ncbi:MAG: hypothetical protein IH596_07445 [Bacteroidales bacterium]|nr:hypothetical protein [Bacteroidales bacterium]